MNKFIVLVGHDGWADARYGDFDHSLVNLNDSRLIAELYQAFLLNKSALKREMQIYADPPLQNYLNASLPKNTIAKILPAVFYEIRPEYFDDSLIMITGGAPGLYTICEGALVLTKDHQTWLAYIDINDDQKKQIVVLCPKSVNCDAQPEPLKKWVNRLLPNMDKKKISYKQMLPS